MNFCIDNTKEVSRKEQKKCIICAGNEVKLLFKENIYKDDSVSLGDRFKNTSTITFTHTGRVVKCKRCGMVYVDSMPHTNAQIRQAYEEVEDILYLKNKQAKMLTFNKVMEWIGKYKSNGRLLDVGCYYGLLLEVAKRRNWNVSGVEFSKKAVKYIKDTFNIDVFNGALMDARYPDSSFDVVTLLAVVEHMLDPRAELDEINRIMKKGGIFAVATHNIESLLAKIMGRHYPWLCEMHLYHFSYSTLERLLEQTGFRVIRYYSYGQIYNLGYVSDRIGKSNFLYNMISKISGLPLISKFNIPINTRDSFLCIAEKK